MLTGPFHRRQVQRRPDSGYVLLVLMLFVSMLMLAALATAPDLAEQIRRDREEEMIHRGTQYERAIQHFVKKIGRYPTSLEELEGTNNIRFLRKRYADPMTPKGQWKLLHVGDIKLDGAPRFGVPVGQAFGQPNAQSTFTLGGPAGSSPGGFGSSSGAGGGFNFGSSFGGSQQGGTGSQAAAPASPTAGAVPNPAGSTPGAGGSTPGSANATGSTQTGGSSGASGSSSGSSTSSTSSSSSSFGVGANFGGGPIIGVASLSEKQGLRVFNNKTHYNEWYFIYDPSLDRGGLLEGPYRTKQFGGATSNVGVPAAAGASGQQPGTNSLFTPLSQPAPGGQPGGFGMQPGGFGMQPQSNPQPQTPQSPR